MYQKISIKKDYHLRVILTFQLLALFDPDWTPCQAFMGVPSPGIYHCTNWLSLSLEIMSGAGPMLFRFASSHVIPLVPTGHFERLCLVVDKERSCVVEYSLIFCSEPN